MRIDKEILKSLFFSILLTLLLVNLLMMFGATMERATLENKLTQMIDTKESNLEAKVKFRMEEIIMDNKILKVLDMLHTEFERPEATESSRLVEDLHFGKIDLLGLQYALEEDFNILIPDEEVETWKTVGDIIKTVEGK